MVTGEERKTLLILWGISPRSMSQGLVTVNLFLEDILKMIWPKIMKIRIVATEKRKMPIDFEVTCKSKVKVTSAFVRKLVSRERIYLQSC